MKKIAIIGSPGSGKSTLANGLYYFLKINKYHAEVVPELIKYKLYQDLNFTEAGFDILNTLEQKKFEDQFNTKKALKEIDYLICEAPLCNGFFYASFYKKEQEIGVLKEIASSNINYYDVILFVKHIDENEYVNFGRKESYTKSIQMENHIINKLKELNFSKKIIEVNQKSDIKKIMQSIV